MVAVTALAIALAGFFCVDLRLWQVLSLLAASLLLIYPSVFTGIVGNALAAVIVLTLAIRRRNEAVAVAVCKPRGAYSHRRCNR